MRVCGLKQNISHRCDRRTGVTPYAGVWIETEITLSNGSSMTSHTLCGCVD